ncbi:MAG: hypothetical protein GEV08_24860 [Acidimicrobiia bacterium]|nr:hypothetical protein [Acidimicrobiia bacterium]
MKGQPEMPGPGRWATRRAPAAGPVVLLAHVVVLALVLSGCGVALEGRARATPREEVPYGLLEPGTSTSTTAAPGSGAVLYLVGQDGLEPVRRPVRAPTSVRAVVEALGQAPPAEEEEKGLRSVLAAEAFVLGARAISGVASIDLADRFRSLPEREQTLALAQLVLTSTEVTDIERVAFTLNGEPLDVPTADGTLRSGSVTRQDYQSLLRATASES